MDFLPIRVLFAFMLVCASSSSGASIKSDQIDINDIIEKIPEEERSKFIKEQLYLAYGMKNDDDHYKIPPEETLAIFEYFRQNQLVTDSETLYNIQDIICFPNGDCFDSDDPGAYPHNDK